ncbi:PREDICTED: uncharacterized protein LOC104733332 [Camelina sativa]|uniref:Uncharacterized protein LOC104733332 n=1 Tax=Camelina sativa TaxID=90675 RepID=A0ABM1QQM1_CAMSA|nr:PREDICTED: uncharacterized protein LOC104733332 [Camelina sativa]
MLSVAGVNAVEYNVEQGLLTVSGDVNPTTLLDKLTKWGKTAELVSGLGDNTSHVVPRTPEQNRNNTMEKKEKRPTKCCLLMCFGKRSCKSKVEPFAPIPNRHHRGVGAENGSPTPLINVALPPTVYPPPRAMPGFTTPIPYPPPWFVAARQAQPYTGEMYRSVPPQSRPYFQLRPTEFPPMANSRLHYPHH